MIIKVDPYTQKVLHMNIRVETIESLSERVQKEMTEFQNYSGEIPAPLDDLKTLPLMLVNDILVIDEALHTQQAESKARELWKQERTKRVSEIKVTTAAGEFDGDETSQTRMSRAISVMSDTDTTTWILADNTPATVTKAELKEALKLAGEEQTFIWIQ